MNILMMMTLASLEDRKNKKIAKKVTPANQLNKKKKQYKNLK